MKKPFLSVIIPTYNPTIYNLHCLLSSLEKQQMDKEDLEIIIADDCSTQNYFNVLTSYNNSLNIRFIKTKYNCCPGNTRTTGINIATGEWITFADQDDFFKSNVFKTIKTTLQKNPEVNFIQTGLLYKEGYTDKILMKYQPKNMIQGWLHGKFFHLEKCWKKYGLYFPKDLKNCEDIALQTQLITLLKTESDFQSANLNLITYNWCRHKTSVSNKNYKQGSWENLSFKDYTYATLELIFEACKTGKYKGKEFERCCQLLYMIYERSERNLCYDEIFIPQHYEYLNQLLIKILDYYKKDLDDIKNIFYNNQKTFLLIHIYAVKTSAQYLYQDSFIEWLKRVKRRQLNNDRNE